MGVLTVCRDSRTLIITAYDIVAVEERSAGSVVYRESDEGRIYLLLQNSGRWDFPKGRVEKGESEVQTVLREVRKRQD